MKIDLNKPLKALNGEIIKNDKDEPVMIGQTIAGVMVMQTKGDILKYFGWATQLYQGKAVEMDKSDINVLRGFIENSDNMTILLKAQALEIIEKAEKLKAA